MPSRRTLGGCQVIALQYSGKEVENLEFDIDSFVLELV
jgi:hypothetical protein